MPVTSVSSVWSRNGFCFIRQLADSWFGLFVYDVPDKSGRSRHIGGITTIGDTHTLSANRNLI